jgi:hypothetical protein
MRSVRLAVLLATLASCSPSSTEPGRSEACLDLTIGQPEATFSGKLTVQLFAGPPNYQSIANGDAEEDAFILELPTRACASDGEFIDASTSFDRVQISAEDASILNVLRSAVRRNVTVRGEAFGAHTGHHHAPLVLFVQEIAVQ